MKKLLITILALTALLSACKKEKEDADPARIRTEILQQLRSADKMVFASMSITKTAKLEDSEWYKIGKRIAVYSYDSHMNAFIDLSELSPDDISFNEADSTVRVTLPPVRTEVTGRDMEMTKEYENIGPLRSEIDSKERAAMKEQANSSFRSEIEDNPRFRAKLKETAERKARGYFETLFKDNGFTAIIDFKE